MITYRPVPSVLLSYFRSLFQQTEFLAILSSFRTREYECRRGLLNYSPQVVFSSSSGYPRPDPFPDPELCCARQTESITSRHIISNPDTSSLAAKEPVLTTRKHHPLRDNSFHLTASAGVGLNDDFRTLKVQLIYQRGVRFLGRISPPLLLHEFPSPSLGPR